MADIALALERRGNTNQGMQISHETIYRSLFIETRGVLKKELMAHLRTARQMRQAKGGTRKSGSAETERGESQGALSGTCEFG